MEYTTLLEVLGNYGAIGLLTAGMYLLFRELQDTRKSHREEVKLLADAVNNNTRVLERLEVKINVEHVV